MLRLFLLVPLLVFCRYLAGQATVTLSFDQQAVEEVIDQLERDYRLIFAYTNDIIKDQFITAHCRGLPLEQALRVLFVKTDLTYKIIGGQYVVLQAKESVLLPSYQLCGRVTDDQGEGLPFANLFVLRTSTGGSSEEDGSFELRVRGELDDLVEISYLGFETQKKTVQQLLECPIVSLSPASFSFQEVVIKEYIMAGIEQADDLDHFVLRPDRIYVVPGLTEADVLQMTQILPGIQSQDESATQLNIRGGTPDQNLLLWDGIPIYNGGHFFGMISSFNPYIVEQVDVYRSGFGPQYGGRVAGVVDIQSVDEVPREISGNAGINLTHLDAAFKIPLFEQKAALIVSGRRAYSDILESPTYRRLSQRVFQRGKIGEAQNQEEEENIDFDLNFVFDDWNIKWLWQPSERDRISLSWFGVQDRLNFLAEVAFEEARFHNLDDLDLTSQGLGLQWERQWNERFRSNWRYASTGLNAAYQLQFEYFEAGILEDDINYEQQNEIEDNSLSWSNHWQISAGRALDFGYQFQDVQVSRSWVWNEDEMDDNTDTNAFHSFFVDLHSNQEGPWSSQAGLRWTYSEALRQDYGEPRLSLQYAPSDRWQIRASVGQYFQFLSQVVELNDLGLNQQLWVLADDEEEPPVGQSGHYSLGVFYQPTSFQLEVEAYYKTVHGITSFSPAFLDESRSLQEEDIYEEGSGTAWGIDVLLRNRWKKYQAWVSYSYGRVFYTFDSFQSGDPFPASHDRPHSFTTVHQWNLNRWLLSLSWNWRSGRAYTAAVGVGVNEEEGEVENFPLYDFSQTNAQRLPVYHRLDASVLYRFPIGSKGVFGKVGLSMLNLYNRENILSRQYFSYFEETEAIDDFVLEPIDRAMLRFTPNMVVRMAW